MKILARQLFDGVAWHIDQELLDDTPSAQMVRGFGGTGPHHDLESGSDALSMTSVVIPGMVNVHSHAFQVGFAGRCEARAERYDSFWSWRRAMYAFLEGLGPESMYEVARTAYTRMLRAGYTWVGEFHYVHHDARGRPYADSIELADAVIRGARDAGIHICLLLSLYQRGGFDGRPLEGQQRRFGYDIDSFLGAFQKLADRWRDIPGVRLGIAPHSLRAVDVCVVAEVVDAASHIVPNCPIHMHLAEQPAEVEECLAATGRRPLELLMEHIDLGPRWCLIHATHSTADDCHALAKSGAVVGLCPTTEANLGDGIFPAEQLAAAQGAFAIGSDSQITINPFAELRHLEYSQRLRHLRRVILATANQSAGRWLWAGALSGGRLALGLSPGVSSSDVPGNRTVDDWLILNESHPAAGNREDAILDTIVFHDAEPPVAQTCVDFRWRTPPDMV